LVLSSLLTFSLDAQSVLFAEIGSSTSVLTTQQLTNYNKMNLSGQYSSLHIIQLNELNIIENNGQINIQFTESSCNEAIFIAKIVNYTAANEFVWYGDLKEVVNSSCKTGSLFLSKSIDGISGNFQIGNESFDIQDLGEGKQICY
jgi:hypothetical protein